MCPDDSQHSLEAKAGFSRRALWANVRESLGGSDQDYTSGSLNRAVLLLAIPMVLEMAGEALFAVVDAFFVARLGAPALAAVGLTEAVLEIIYAVAVGLSMSTTAMVARRFGEKDERGAARAGAQAIWVGIAVSVILGIAGVIWAPDILRLMGASPETVEMGTTYTRIMYGGMVVIVLLFLNNAIYRGAGDASMAMRSVWLANGINIVLDPLLIFGVGPFPELGLAGAAVATTIGRGIGVYFQLSRMGRGPRLWLRWSDMVPDISIIGRLLRISAGGVGQILVGQASYVVLIRILAMFGDVVLAGYVLAFRVVLFILLPAWGLSNAAATLVGQNLGAEKPDRAERSVWVTGAWNMGFLGIVSLIVIAFTHQILTPFAEAGAMHAEGVEALRIISYGFVFYGWGMVSIQAFNGAGDTRTPTWISFAVFWLFEIPLAYWFANAYGASGVYWSIALSYSLFAVSGVLMFRRGTWKHQQV